MQGKKGTHDPKFDGVAYARDYYGRLRDAVLAFMGGRCVRCGFSDKRALQVDHIDGRGRLEHRSIGNMGIYKKVLADPAWASKYQLLCANCNWIKRHEVGGHEQGGAGHRQEDTGD